MIAVTAIPDPQTCREIDRVLAQAGWSVYTARDADEVLHLCRKAQADVLMLDDGFPGGAVSLIERLKRDSELFRMQVVLVGSGLDVGGVAAAMQRGASDVLRTPLDPVDIVARAAAAFRTAYLVRELTNQNDRLEGLVFYDELTGLRNRRAILQDLDMRLATALRHERDLSVLMIDVDHFKAINDEHGHRAGDEVLREVAERLQERLRKTDAAGRLGGDELLVVLPETGADGATTVARSIRTAVAEAPVDTSVGPVPVTVSIGSAASDGEVAEMLIERADRALYAAKAAGRDCAVAS